MSNDLSDAIYRINIEMKRLGWSIKMGREHLMRTYGKQTRPELSEEELLEFLNYLESLPSEISGNDISQA